MDWVDSYSEHGWMSEEEALLNKPAECSSVGFLLLKNNKYVILAQSDSSHNVADLITIPKGCITNIQYLKVV